MARGRRSSSSTSSLLIVLVIAGCTSFALGLLSPPPKRLVAAALAHPVKTQVRALADGMDLGMSSWVGLNDPSIDQSALLTQRLARSATERSPSRRREAAAAIRSKAGLLRLAHIDQTESY